MLQHPGSEPGASERGAGYLGVGQDRHVGGLLLVRYALLHVKNKQMCVSWRKSSGKEKQQPFLRVNLINDSKALGLGLVCPPASSHLCIYSIRES